MTAYIDNSAQRIHEDRDIPINVHQAEWLECSHSDKWDPGSNLTIVNLSPLENAWKPCQALWIKFGRRGLVQIVDHAR